MKKYAAVVNLLFALASINSFAQITTGLKAYYPFNGNAYDASGQSPASNGNIMGNASLSSDRFGSPDCAFQFPGNATSYIRIPYSWKFDIPPTGAFSLSLWFQGGTPNGGDFEVLFEKENPLVNPHHSDYHLGLYDINNPSFGSLYSPIVMSSTGTQPDPNWHHVVAIYDNKNWYIYEDNVLRDSDTAQTYGIYQSTNDIFIGKSFMGKIDDIRFYDRVLTVPEINEIFTLPGSCGGLSVGEVLQKDRFEIYPNPAQTILNIVAENDGENSFTVYDMTGREVMNFTTYFAKNEIDISTLQEGTYLIKNKTAEAVYSKLIMKKK